MRKSVRGDRAQRPAVATPPRPITEFPEQAEPRLAVEWNELNRVLGGGVVAGSVVLLAGEPGVGKSTLLMHLAEQVARSGRTVLYCSGEESAQQVRMRARRLGALHPGLLLLADNDLDSILASITGSMPALAIVDSIQTVYDPAVDAAAGSVSQVREGAARLLRAAKESGVPLILVGHVTKEGAIAGPRVLEHMVDTVLYLEGERRQEWRILRANKNRFGSTEEIGIFAMVDAGMEEVDDASAMALGGSAHSSPGTAVVATMEGTRPLLVELQSLTSPMAFGLPRRSATGVELNRLHMILAVLAKRAGAPLDKSDVFVNVAGGIRVTEPAADLGLALSLVSNLRDRPLPDATVVVGELGLTGEVRRVSQLDRRLGEAARRGFTRALIPAPGPRQARSGRPAGLETVEVRTLAEAIAAAFPARIGSGAISSTSGRGPRGTS